LAALYWKFAKGYYQKNGKPSGSLCGIKVALRILRHAYGHTLASQFGPLSLKSLQTKMIELGQSRRYINDNVHRIRRMFHWAVGEELVSPTVYQALTAVPGLRKGRTEARETQPVEPVANATVDTTLPHLPAVVAAMVRFQRLTGARPGEVCILRPCNVDTSGDVWSYRPESHKTEHHGREEAYSVRRSRCEDDADTCLGNRRCLVGRSAAITEHRTGRRT
jgi:integrase